MPQNLLPRDGEAYDYGVVFSQHEADAYFQQLLHATPWQQDEGVMFGKPYKTARKMAWFGEKSYSYSGKKHMAHGFTPLLLVLKTQVESVTQAQYNSCLLNLYEEGSQSMGWHSDDEKEIMPLSTIVSVSFGAVRRFELQHKHTREKVKIILEHGALLTMAGECQRFWKHQLPKSLPVKTPRINLTFRLIC